MKSFNIAAIVSFIVADIIGTSALTYHYYGLSRKKKCLALLMQYRDATQSYIDTLDNNTFADSGYLLVSARSTIFLRDCNALHPFYSYTADLTWHWTEIYQDLRASELRMIQRND